METVNDLISFYTQRPEWVVISLLGAVCSLFGGLLWNKSELRRGIMKRRARREVVTTEAADEFTSAVEDMVANDKWSRSEATEVYRKLKQLFPVKDLYPSTEPLKARILRRLGTHYTKEKKGKSLLTRN